MLRQIEIGRAHTVIWRPAALPTGDLAMHCAVAGGASASAVLTSAVRRTNGTPVPTAAVVVAGATRLGPDPDAVVGTTPDPALLGGLVGDHGGTAWLDLGGAGAYAVRPMRVAADGTVTLAHVAAGFAQGLVGVAGTLHWNVWRGEIDAGALGAAVVRTGRWAIPYTAVIGGAYPGEQRTERGALRVVRTAFSTGLGSADLGAFVPRLPATVPDGQTSYTPQVAWTMHELVQDIERALESTARGGFADQLSGAGFQAAHAWLVYRRLIDAGHVAGDAEEARANYYAALQAAIRRADWIDTDDDGAIDTTEAAASGTWAAGLGFRSQGSDLAAAYAAGTLTRPTLDYTDR